MGRRGGYGQDGRAVAAGERKDLFMGARRGWGRDWTWRVHWKGKRGILGEEEGGFYRVIRIRIG